MKAYDRCSPGYRKYEYASTASGFTARAVGLLARAYANVHSTQEGILRSIFTHFTSIIFSLRSQTGLWRSSRGRVLSPGELLSACRQVLMRKLHLISQRSHRTSPCYNQRRSCGARYGAMCHFSVSPRVRHAKPASMCVCCTTPIFPHFPSIIVSLQSKTELVQTARIRLLFKRSIGSLIPDFAM